LDGYTDSRNTGSSTNQSNILSYGIIINRTKFSKNATGKNGIESYCYQQSKKQRSERSEAQI
jgi:hypothetical protein